MKKQFDIKKLVLLNLPYLLMGLFATNFGEAWRLAQGGKCFGEIPFPVCCPAWGVAKFLAQPASVGSAGGTVLRRWPSSGGVPQKQEC